MTELELKERFKKFSVRIIKMVDSMPDTISGRAIGAQAVRSGTSIVSTRKHIDGVSIK